MKIPKTSVLMEVRCEATNKKARRCGRFLGRFQSEGTNVYGDFCCASCKAVTQFHIDGFGLLHRDVVRSPELFAPAIPAYIKG